MPSRVIKESFLTSRSIARLSTAAENHFIRLTLLKDDWGCFEATPEFVKGHCYTYHANITPDNIYIFNAELETNGDIRYWEQDDRIYGVFINHDKHTTHYSVSESGEPTRHRRKTPEPPKSIFTKEYKPVFSININKPADLITGNNTSKQPVSNPVPNPVLVPNPNPVPKKELTNGNARELVAYFYKLWESKKGEVYPNCSWGKHGSMIKNALKTCQQEKLKELMEKYLADYSDFNLKCGHSVEVFISSLPGLLTKKPKTFEEQCKAYEGKK
jgi:hypothetical protein